MTQPQDEIDTEALAAEAEQGYDPAGIVARYRRRGKPHLAGAVAALQRQNPQVGKGSTAEVATRTGGKYSYSYADLADIKKVVFPLSGGESLAYICKLTLSKKWAKRGHPFVLKCRLEHSPSGESEKAVLPMPSPEDKSWQDIGGASTYGARYNFTLMTGVTPSGEDVDAMNSRGEPATGREPRPEPSGRAWDIEIMDAKDLDTLRKLWADMGQHGERTKELSDAVTQKGRALQAAEQAAAAQTAAAEGSQDAAALLADAAAQKGRADDPHGPVHDPDASATGDQ